MLRAIVRHPLTSALLTLAVMLFLAAIIAGHLTPASPQPMDIVRYIKEPPWQYDYPYRGTLIIRERMPHEVHDECTEAGGTVAPRRLIIACALLSKDETHCILFLPLNFGQWSNEELRLIIRHEIAHCNGWPADHSDGLAKK